MSSVAKDSRKMHRAWSMYDWANSAYNLVITSTIFPTYYIGITSDNNDATVDYVSFFGWKVVNSSLLNYALAFAYLIIALLSPILSSIADYKGSKKRFMQLFCAIGSLACAGMYFFKADTLEMGIVLCIFAAIGYCGSLVFYNAYLPEIATPEQQDKVSAQGFAYGYVGSVLLQVVCLIFVMKPEWFPFLGISDGGDAARFSFLMVGIWWIAFAQIPFRVLPKGKPALTQRVGNVLTGGFIELRKVWQQVKSLPVLKRFLAAFFCYSMGVQTVMLAAAEFGSKEIKKEVDGKWVSMEAGDLIITILLIQLVAIAGAMLMAKLSQKWGNLKVLMITVLIWIGVCIGAYFTRTNIQFYMIAVVVGLVMGGIQSLSRSTYSKLMPPTHDTTSFFSFYDVTEKVAIVIGMFSFGFIEHITGDMRNAIVALVLFFVAGFLFLIWANFSSGKKVLKVA